MQQDLPLVCVVVPVHNRLELTLRFLQNFSKSTYPNYRIVIIDDGSSDGTADAIISQYSQITLLKGDGNLWWTGATNMGVDYATANGFDYVLTINQDAVVSADYLAKLVSCATSKPDSIWGSAIVDEFDGAIWSLGVSSKWKYSLSGDFPKHSVFKHNYHGADLEEVRANLPQPLKVDALNGDGTLIPISVFSKIGKYDYAWCPQYHADTDLTLRAAKSGISSYVCLDAVLQNHNVETSSIKNPWQRLTSKKSDLYWRAIVKLYIAHAPIIYKPLILWVYGSHLFQLTVKLIKSIIGQ